MRSFGLLHPRSPTDNARHKVGTRRCHDPAAEHRLQRSGFHIVHALWVGVIIKMSTDQNATSHPRGMILRSFRRGWL
jgi:hypothetical protein